MCIRDSGEAARAQLDVARAEVAGARVDVDIAGMRADCARAEDELNALRDRVQFCRTAIAKLSTARPDEISALRGVIADVFGLELADVPIDRLHDTVAVAAAPSRSRIRSRSRSDSIAGAASSGAGAAGGALPSKVRASSGAAMRELVGAMSSPFKAMLTPPAGAKKAEDGALNTA